MGLVAKDSGGGTFTPAPAGTHRAVCFAVIDLGTQWSEFYKTSKRKVTLGWELADETDEEGKPFVVWKRYTISLHENAALRQHLEAWRGRPFSLAELEGFHLKSVLGVPCMLSVGHTKSDDGKKTYANVNAVMALAKGMDKPKAKAKHILFDIDDWDQAAYDGFSDHLRKTIDAAEERQGKPATAATAASGAKPAAQFGVPPSEDDEDIPF
jgi:hypothetical protein